jgi:hypothetical protein
MHIELIEQGREDHRHYGDGAVEEAEKHPIDDDDDSARAEKIEDDPVGIPIASEEMNKDEGKRVEWSLVWVVTDRELSAPEFLGGHDEFTVEVGFDAESADWVKLEEENRGAENVDCGVREGEDKIQAGLAFAFRCWRGHLP